MPTYVVLERLTDEGTRGIKDTVKRARAARQAIEAAGGKVTGIWWTQGQYDGLLIAEVPDDAVAMLLLLATAQQGHTRTETLRAYSEEEMERIVQRLP